MNNKENIITNFKIKDCSGCQACINICPTHALYSANDQFGFIEPRIHNEKCIYCGKCLEICPWRKLPKLNNPINAYAAVNKNENIVMNSSSGGIFFSLAADVLKKDGVVCGVELNKRFQVCHVIIDSISDIPRIQKSKYVQSNIGLIYKRVQKYLDENRIVLFTGTPCQVAGLKKYLVKSYSNLYTMDVVCHGVPSQSLFNDYIDNFQSKYGELENYSFRAKKKAKNGMNWFFSYQLHGKRKTVRNWPEDSYNYLYMKGLIYRESCYNCKFATIKRVSDLTLCDYWNWNKYHINDFHINSSVSGILVNTNKGIQILNNINSSFNIKSTDIENIIENNACLAKPVPYDPKRENILGIWKNRGYMELDKLFNKKMRKTIFKYRILDYMPESIKSILSRIKRIKQK
jgi:coenzyme F420-reducing hydrogenase beta subunit